MKINSISNTNFKGLFTDKSSKYGGNWHMEYSPYSWEVKMAPKTQFELTDSYLPDNEEIFSSYRGRETSSDILRTVSYIKDTENGNDILRNSIIETPSMNLEESLKVKDKKLAVFLDTKKLIMEDLKEVLEQKKKLFDLSKEHEKYASDLMNGYFTRSYPKETSVTKVKKTFDKLMSITEDFGTSFEDYIKLVESSEKIAKTRAKIKNELEKIKNAKKEKNLIDISRRDVESPNEPLIRVLKEASKGLVMTDNKIVALPHRTIRLQDIYSAIRDGKSVDQVMNFVELLIKRA